MDHDVDVIRVVERRGGSIERGIVEVPFRRSGLPNEPGEIAPVLLVTGSAAFGGEIILVPPIELGLGRQRRLVGFLAADQITLTETRALQRSGHNAATMSAVRAPQSKPARVAFPIRSASIKATISSATTDCWPLRNVSPERNRVVP
jgi:hypothetical protein